jgi:hypothetical protein
MLLLEIDRVSICRNINSCRSREDRLTLASESIKKVITHEGDGRFSELEPIMLKIIGE